MKAPNQGGISELSWQIRFVVLLILTCVLGSAAYFTIDAYVEATSAAQQAQLREQMVAVIVMAHDRDAQQVITAQDIQQRMYPPEYVNDNWLVPADAAAIVGRRLVSFVERGQPLTLADLELDYSQFFSQQLATDEVAITVTLGLEQSHHGMVSVGDRVTLVVRDDNHHLQLIQGVRIAALDHFQQVESAHVVLPTTATLAMTIAQAVQFENYRYQSLSLWLRHPEAKSIAAISQPSRLHFFQREPLQ
ncbi:MAG TPA: SAF domain-containing protein [Pseudidiomarina sp.]|nr:SAF domain-containing protein [Pseudidiomarina sp.]